MLLARMAEAVYWAGRYLERAEDTARIVQVHGETHIDLPVGEDVGWAPLVEIAGTMAGFHERNSQLGSGTTAAAFKRSLEARVVAYVLTDRDNPSSILASIAGARDNLRLARPVVPREVWELCNELWISLSPVSSTVGRPRPTRAVAPAGDRRDPADQRGHAGHDAARRGAGLLPHGPATRAGRDHVPGPGRPGRQRRARSRAARSTTRSTRWRCSDRSPRTSRSVGPCRLDPTPPRR